jgi:hypothetical protein
MDKWPQEMIKVVIFFTVMSFLTSGLLYCAIRGFRTFRREKKAEEMLNWLTITATAIKSEAVYGTDSRGRYRHYAPRITYIYKLNNRNYFIDVSDQKFYLSNDESKAKNDAE